MGTAGSGALGAGAGAGAGAAGAGAPGAGAAVKLTAVGRRLYYVQCLTEKLDWAIDENLIITVPLEVKEST